ncbi:hypothetical protein D3C78_888580 [compost metagenome]
MTQPTAPVITEARRIIKHIISSFLSELDFLVIVSTGIAWINTSVSTKPRAASTTTSIKLYQLSISPIKTLNSCTITVEVNTRIGADDSSAFS